MEDTKDTAENTANDKELELQKELDSQKDKYLRLYAEFDNFRKRSAKEKSELVAIASEEVIKTILPTLDNFERAITNSNDDGVKLVYNGLLKSLEAKGLTVMESIGVIFTPELHEAIAQVKSEDMKGKVVDVLEKGYLLNGKVIRFAKVAVGY
jgi:molecular chaperone GrpE